MAKRIAIGPKYRRGMRLLDESGKVKQYLPGDLLPLGTEIPNRFFRDKRVVRVEGESVKKTPLKPAPKKTATPSPSSGVVGSSDPAPLEVTAGAAEDKPVEKKKRKRKKLFSSD